MFLNWNRLTKLTFMYPLTIIDLFYGSIKSKYETQVTLSIIVYELKLEQTYLNRTCTFLDPITHGISNNVYHIMT